MARQRQQLAGEVNTIRKALQQEEEAGRAIHASISEAERDLHTLKAKMLRTQPPGHTPHNYNQKIPRCVYFVMTRLLLT
jgi:hypothetical protein